MPLRAFELLPAPGQPSLENPIWIAADPLVGRSHRVVFMGSLEAVNILIELELRGKDAFALIRDIEDFVKRNDRQKLARLDRILLTDKFLEEM